MKNDIAIEVKNVSKSFRLPHEKQSSIKGVLINRFKGGKRSYEVQEVLKDISFNIRKGEFFGIVGRNGSGKSTLLKMLAGTYTPTAGSVKVEGTLTPFIELGVGFNPELTGRENVFLNGALLGFDRKDMETMYQDIVSFAELDRFMDQKLKNYSSGMQVRLAFSIAIRAQSDILILDEVLAVGDAAFQRKCYDYFMSLKKNKRTVVLVTHDMGAVRQYCDRAVMIEAGEVVKTGKPEVVAQSYQKLFSDESESATSIMDDDAEDRWGEGDIVSDEATASVSDDYVHLKTTYVAKKATDAPIYGFTLYGPNGTNILEHNTLRAKQPTEAVVPGQRVTVEWQIPNIFAAGRYSVSVACCDMSATRFYDWLNQAVTFNIKRDDQTAGLVDPDTKIINYTATK